MKNHTIKTPKPYGFTSSTEELSKAFGEVTGTRQCYTNARQIRFVNGEQWILFGVNTCYKPYPTEMSAGKMKSTLRFHRVFHTLKKKELPILRYTPSMEADGDPREDHNNVSVDINVHFHPDVTHSDFSNFYEGDDNEENQN